MLSKQVVDWIAVHLESLRINGSDTPHDPSMVLPHLVVGTDCPTPADQTPVGMMRRPMRNRNVAPSVRLCGLNGTTIANHHSCTIVGYCGLYPSVRNSPFKPALATEV